MPAACPLASAPGLRLLGCAPAWPQRHRRSSVASSQNGHGSTRAVLKEGSVGPACAQRPHEPPMQEQVTGGSDSGASTSGTSTNGSSRSKGRVNGSRHSEDNNGRGWGAAPSQLNPSSSKPFAPPLCVFGTKHGCEGTELINSNLANGYWLVSLFTLRGWPIPAWPMAIYTAYVIACVAVLEEYETPIFVLDPENARLFQGLSTAMSLVGTALFFLLTFRVNSAYQRWHSGIELWSQATAYICGMSRMVSSGNLRSQRLCRSLLRWSMAYLITLKVALSGGDSVAELEDILSGSELREVLTQAPSQRALLCVQRIQECCRDAQAEGLMEPCSVFETNFAIPGLTLAMVNMQAIMQVGMPFAYIAHLRVFLIIWLITVPFVFTYFLQYNAIGCSMVIGYALLGMEAISLEVEYPFGDDFSDLPIQTQTAATVRMLLSAYQSTTGLQTSAAARRQGSRGDGAMAGSGEGHADDGTSPLSQALRIWEAGAA